MPLTQEQVKEQIFASVAEKHSENLPLKISLATTSAHTTQDIAELKEKELLVWDFNMKSIPCMSPVSNPDQMLSCIAYYGDAENGWVCIGYALGCISKDFQAIEVTHIEKRKDAGDDLKSKFLPVIVDAFVAYGLYLNHITSTRISKFVFVGPVPGVLDYYKQQGFEYIDDYSSSGSDAVVKYMK